MEILIGKVKHFYGHVPAMVVELDEDLKIGDEIIVKKKNGKERFRQKVESMEIERKKIQSAKAGTEVAILAAGKTKEGDLVYKIVQ
jgi:putative protease